MATALYLLNINFLKDEQVFQHKIRGLNKTQQAYIFNKKNKEDQIRSLGARLLLNKVLSDKLVDNQEILYGRHGKPYLKNENQLYFNLSHSEEYIGCIVGEKEVGLDIQFQRKISDKIVEKCFTKEEMIKYNHLEDKEDKTKFIFRHWSAKESYIKCLGVGLQKPFNQLEVDLNNMTIYDLESNELHCLKEYFCLEEYALFACCKTDDFQLFVKTIYYRL